MATVVSLGQFHKHTKKVNVNSSAESKTVYGWVVVLHSRSRTLLQLRSCLHAMSGNKTDTNGRN